MYRFTRWFRRWIGLRSWFIARHHQEIYFETDQIAREESTGGEGRESYLPIVKVRMDSGGLVIHGR